MIVALAAMLATANSWAASPNIVEQWNKIAEDTEVTSGTTQGEGEIYMSYVSAAVYDVVVAINGRYNQLGTAIAAPPGASTEAAVIEAALRHAGELLPGEVDGWRRREQRPF